MALTAVATRKTSQRLRMALKDWPQSNRQVMPQSADLASLITWVKRTQTWLEMKTMRMKAKTMALVKALTKSSRMLLKKMQLRLNPL